MASLHSIKKRREGIRNINQMTSAMELVAATKMRKAQEAALSSRAYAFTGLELLANLVESLRAQTNLDHTQTNADFASPPTIGGARGGIISTPPNLPYSRGGKMHIIVAPPGAARSTHRASRRRRRRHLEIPSAHAWGCGA